MAVRTQLHLQLYIPYQLHISAASDLAIIRLDTIIRETIQHNMMQSSVSVYVERDGMSFTSFWGMCTVGNDI
jgi:hypothetical protein